MQNGQMKEIGLPFRPYRVFPNCIIIYVIIPAFSAMDIF